jgi:hypothetical protein
MGDSMSRNTAHGKSEKWRRKKNAQKGGFSARVLMWGEGETLVSEERGANQNAKKAVDQHAKRGEPWSAKKGVANPFSLLVRS